MRSCLLAFALLTASCASAEPADLKVNDAEIQEARWFTREEAALMLAGKHPQELWLPGPQSMAHHLVKAFLERQA